jgi:copper transport protein
LFVNIVRHLGEYIPILLIIIIVIISIYDLNQSVISQEGETTMSMSNLGGSEESVTSYTDALIKAPLLVSQSTIVGMVFSQLILSKILRTRVLMNSDSHSHSAIMNTDFGIAKRLVLVLIMSVIALIVFATGLFILQVYNLSSELSLGFSDTLSILLNTSVGTIWLLRIVTSILVLVLTVMYYIIVRRDIYSKKDSKNSITRISYVILCAILISGSINLISNSMVSHNAAAEFLPWLAISIDWFHVMAVSIWLGGLFYLSLILIYAIQFSNKDLEDKTDNSKMGNQVVIRNSFSLAIMLPYFSMIAIICLGIIGISGLYMAWLQIQSVGSLFDSLYGNILILKLCAIIPMIVLGAYHQIKLHYVMVRTARKEHKIQQQPEILSESKQGRESRDSHSNRGGQYDPFRRFSKTIKIESLIGIVVLTISSFLTITSPPSMVQSDSQMQMSGSELGNNNFDNSIGDETKIIPKITDGFTIVALALAIIILIMCLYSYRKNKQELKTTINLLKVKRH